MSNPWFRLYKKTIDNDKLKLLAFEDRWHFIALCCLKCDGLLDEPDTDLRTRRIAVKMGLQTREVEEVKRRLMEVDLIDKNMNPKSWDDLQFNSDTSTDRVRKYRAKTKTSRSETAKKRFRNGVVTAQDTETDTETEERGASGDASPSVEKAFSNYNIAAQAFGLPIARVLTADRRKGIQGILADHGSDGWKDALVAIEGSAFLRGENDRGWKLDLNFLLTPENFARVLEGSYADAD